MEKKENLFIKVQLEKEQYSGRLMINIYFDKNAPNFFLTNNTINWYPTMDELSFINETFTLLNKNTPTPATPQPTYAPTPSETKTPIEEPPEIVSFDEEPIQTPITADASFDTHCEETPTKPPFVNDASPEEILASIPVDSMDNTPPPEEKLVQADDKSITKALLEKLKKDHY